MAGDNEVRQKPVSLGRDGVSRQECGEVNTGGAWQIKSDSRNESERAVRNTKFLPGRNVGWEAR